MLRLPGPIAQRLEQATHNRLVGGSNPSGPTILAFKNRRSLTITGVHALHGIGHESSRDVRHGALDPHDHHDPNESRGPSERAHPSAPVSTPNGYYTIPNYPRPKGNRA
jgi:hypothetical protein